LPMSFVIGAVIFENPGTNMWWYPATPRKLHASLRFLRCCGHSLRPAIFAGSTVAPSFESHTPKKFICGCMNMLLDNLRCRPCSVRISKRSWIITVCRSHSEDRVAIPMSSI
jgi:hypothetical protein